MNKMFAVMLKKPQLCVIVFFLIYLAIGVSIYRDYGISWDEPSHREMASVSAKYVSSIFLPNFHPSQFASLPPLAEYSAKQYGVIFDLPMYVAELLLGYTGKMPQAYYIRHLCTFLLF